MCAAVSRVASFILPATSDRSPMLEKVVQFCGKLGSDKRWRVTVEPYKKTRTGEQNRLLWALYADVLDAGGEMLGGWTKEDLHEWALGEWGGWESVCAFGRTRLRPLRRSSKLSTTDFAEFVEWLVRKMAEHGIYLELPGDL